MRDVVMAALPWVVIGLAVAVFMANCAQKEDRAKSKTYGMAIGMINGDPIPDFREGGYRSLNLPDEVANKILYENSKKLLGENPKPVNRDAVIREISEIEKEIASLSEYEKTAFAEIKAYFMGR